MKKPKRRNKGKLISRAILALAVFYVIFTLYDQHKEITYLKSKEETLIQNIDTVQRDIKLLEDQIENSDTDEYIEKIAREHLKMVKKDELIFIDLGKSN